jgi:hypothetical protein
MSSQKLKFGRAVDIELNLIEFEHKPVVHTVVHSVCLIIILLKKKSSETN